MKKETDTVHVRLLGDKVLVKSAHKDGESKTASGIILPGKEGNEHQERGVVIATGPGRLTGEGKRVAMEVTVGDKIIYKRGYDADEVEIGGEEYILLGESHVLAIESRK